MSFHSPSIAEPSPPFSDPVLRQHLARVRQLRPGLQLHCEDRREERNFTAQAQISAGLRIVVLLEGAVDISYGPQRVALSQGRSGACAALVAVAEPAQFTRRARAGVYSRRLSVGLDGDWLAQASEGGAPLELSNFMHHHLATRQWQLSPRAVALAEQIACPPLLTPFLQHLYLESRTLELVAEALGALCPSPAAPVVCSSLRPREHQRLRDLHAFLQSGQADELSLDAIARHAGLNANSLQRQFRAVYGTTVFELVRECRLQRARQALEGDGVTVGQAATIAGYTSAANFSTAYRRRFGMPPKLARASV